MKIHILLILSFISLNSFGKSMPKVKFHTGEGFFVIKVDTVRAPMTGNHFLHLVKTGIYQNGLIYRVVNDWNQTDNPVRIDVVQGGLYHDDLVNNVRSIPHEPTIKTGIRHRNGVISMARNEPGTASSEFFICIGNQPELDYEGNRNPDGQGFAAFGKVIRGMKIIRKIHSLPDSGQYLIQPIVFTCELQEQ